MPAQPNTIQNLPTQIQFPTSNSTLNMIEAENSTNLVVPSKLLSTPARTSKITNPYVKKKNKLLPHIQTPLAQLDITSIFSKSDFDYDSISSDDSSWNSDASVPKTVGQAPTTRTQKQQRLLQSPPPTQSIASHSTTTIHGILRSVHTELEHLTDLTAQLRSNDAAVQAEIQSLRSQQDQLRSLASCMSSSVSNDSQTDNLASQPPAFEEESGDDVLFTPQISTDDDTNSHQTQSSTVSVNINNLTEFLTMELNNTSLDTITAKREGDFRLFLQNPNSIKIFQDKDPEYLPSIETIKENEADVICLPETNIPWHRNDLYYDISTQNKATWNSIPTKTITAPCKDDRKTYQNYQPGGVMTIVTNTMTTKIKNCDKDYMGRWTKVFFFAT